MNQPPNNTLTTEILKTKHLYVSTMRAEISHSSTGHSKICFNLGLKLRNNFIFKYLSIIEIEKEKLRVSFTSMAE